MYTIGPGPLKRYQVIITDGSVSDDPAQHTALTTLDNLHQQLAQAQDTDVQLQGLYLWGKVGRGKTFLMDLFVSCVEPEHCLRLHFHHFMQSVHQQLRDIEGQADPLKIIATKLSKQYKILCFDEFFVTDIGDAMLLGSLMRYLFERKVIFVATSNIAPDRLYWDGLQRSRFLPAIHAIEEHTQTIHLIGEEDHRERTLHSAPIFFLTSDCDASNATQIQMLFEKLALPVTNKSLDSIHVLGREIFCVSRNSNAICFEFSNLCEGPRSSYDYVEIAKQFEHVLVLNVPPLSGYAYERIKARGTEDGSANSCEGAGSTGEREVVLAPMDDAARRFIALVDEFYECRVKLFLTSDVSLKELYTDGSLLFQFERATSRMTEMASEEYQSLPHQP